MSRLATILFYFLLFFFPVAYAGTRISLQQWMLAGTLLLVSLYLFDYIRKRRVLFLPPGFILLCVLLLYSFLQIVPLPPSLLKLFSPHLAGFFRETVWLWAPDQWMPVSVMPLATLQEGFRLLAAVLFYWVCVQRMSTHANLRRTLLAVTFFAGIYAFWGLMEYLLPNGRVLWVLRPWPEYTGHKFAAYLNGNHYAALMGMLLPPALALYMATRPRFAYLSLKERFIDTFKQPQANLHILSGLSAAVILVSIFCSLSRGGIVSTLVSLLFFILLSWWRSERKISSALTLTVFVLCGLILVGTVGWQPVFERFSRVRNVSGELTDQRLEYWADSVGIIKDYPLTGTGFSTFLDIYPSYKTADTRDLVVDHAHNDYIELLTDGGVIGSVLFFLLAVRVWWVSRRHVAERKSQSSRWFYLGSLAGLLSIALHSVTDFNLHIPANLFFFAFVAAVLVSSGATRSRTVEPPSSLPLLKRTVVFVLFLPLFAGAIWGCIYHQRQLIAQGDYGQFLQGNGVVDDGLLEEKWKTLPWEPRYPYMLGELALEKGDAERASRYFRETVELSPMTSFYWQRLASSLDRMGDAEKAEDYLLRAISVDTKSAERLRDYAVWLYSQGREDEALSAVKKSLMQNPRAISTMLTLMVVNGSSSERMMQAMPDLYGPWVSLGKYYDRQGDIVLADYSFQQVLKYAERSVSTPYWQAYNHYYRQKDKLMALEAIRQGLAALPGDANLHRKAGWLYERLELPYKALEEYRRALQLKPGLKGLKKRIKKLEK